MSAGGPDLPLTVDLQEGFSGDEVTIRVGGAEVFRRPDVRTLLVWLKHCAGFGMPEEGVALFEKGGLAAQLTQLQEDLRYDAEDYYAQCRRRAGRAAAGAEDDSEEPVAGDDE